MDPFHLKSQWFLCLFVRAVVCFSLICKIPKIKALFIYSHNNSVIIKWMLHNSLSGLWSGNHCSRSLTRNFINYFWIMHKWASQVVLVIKNPPANAGDLRDTGSIPGWGRSPGGKHSNPLQCSWLENPLSRGSWRATGHGVSQRQTRLKRLRAHIAAMGTQASNLWQRRRPGRASSTCPVPSIAPDPASDGGRNPEVEDPWLPSHFELQCQRHRA